MAIVQCENHHYYDNLRNQSCPYCAKVNGNNGRMVESDEQMTAYLGYFPSDEEGQLTEAYGDGVEEYDKTIGIFADESCNQPTVGWLVCMNGLVKGKSYSIHAGRNFAGRSEDMDIVLSDDMYISRENHFSLIYDPKSICFYLVKGVGEICVNNERVLEQCLLQDGDEISAGNSIYVFIPFCKEGRVWD